MGIKEFGLLDSIISKINADFMGRLILARALGMRDLLSMFEDVVDAAVIVVELKMLPLGTMGLIVTLVSFGAVPVPVPSRILYINLLKPSYSVKVCIFF